MNLPLVELTTERYNNTTSLRRAAVRRQKMQKQPRVSLRQTAQHNRINKQIY
jgi:hypothetical protein